MLEACPAWPGHIDLFELCYDQMEGPVLFNLENLVWRSVAWFLACEIDGCAARG